MGSFRIFLDTDVLINWLAMETDPNTGFNLWRCPYELVELNAEAYTPEEFLEKYFPNIFERIKNE